MDTAKHTRHSTYPRCPPWPQMGRRGYDRRGPSVPQASLRLLPGGQVQPFGVQGWVDTRADTEACDHAPRCVITEARNPRMPPLRKQHPIIFHTMLLGASACAHVRVCACADGYGSWLDRTQACWDPSGSASRVVRIVDTCKAATHTSHTSAPTPPGHSPGTRDCEGCARNTAVTPALV